MSNRVGHQYLKMNVNSSGKECREILYKNKQFFAAGTNLRLYSNSNIVEWFSEYHFK